MSACAVLGLSGSVGGNRVTRRTEDSGVQSANESMGVSRSDAFDWPECHEHWLGIQGYMWAGYDSEGEDYDCSWPLRRPKICCGNLRMRIATNALTEGDGPSSAMYGTCLKASCNRGSVSEPNEFVNIGDGSTRSIADATTTINKARRTYLTQCISAPAVPDKCFAGVDPKYVDICCDIPECAKSHQDKCCGGTNVKIEQDSNPSTEFCCTTGFDALADKNKDLCCNMHSGKPDGSRREQCCTERYYGLFQNSRPSCCKDFF